MPRYRTGTLCCAYVDQSARDGEWRKSLLYLSPLVFGIVCVGHDIYTGPTSPLLCLRYLDQSARDGAMRKSFYPPSLDVWKFVCVGHVLHATRGRALPRPETATTPMPKPTGYGTRPHPLTFHIHNPITLLVPYSTVYSYTVYYVVKRTNLGQKGKGGAGGKVYCHSQVTRQPTH